MSKIRAYQSRAGVWMMLIFAALMSAGCSTPKIIEPVDTASSAWDAYESCVMALVPYGRQHECDQVSATGGLSYDQYSSRYGQRHLNDGSALSATDAASFNDGYHVYYDFAGSGASDVYDVDPYNDYAYLNYLGSLKAQPLQDLKAQWDELAGLGL
jgi:hypothetical protein